jgi:DNA-binding NarL/FixJ family response regulator
MTMRVLVVDDQELVRDGLAVLLERVPGVTVVGRAGDGHEALAYARSCSPDVVLIDLRMPRMDGIEATRRLVAAHSHIAVLALTTYPDDKSLYGALRAGARGYLTKDATVDQIVEALHTVLRGGTALAATAQARLVAAALGDAEQATPAPDQLTTREIQVLRLMADGLRNEQIAARLAISTATVKSHVNHIFAKIGVVDRAQAVAYAFRTGLATG